MYLTSITLQHNRPLFFHRLIRIALLFAGRLSVVILRTIFLAVTGFRKLGVEGIVVNNAFLLANSMVVIHWRVKNALWIKVDGKWMGNRGNQVLVLATQGRRTVSVFVQGLFSSYKKQFDVSCDAEVVALPPRFPDWTFAVDHRGLTPVFSPASLVFTGRSFLPAVPLVAITIPSIPSIQTENLHETRLLHHP